MEPSYPELIEESRDALIALSPEGVVLAWNGGAEALFGYTAAEAIGEPFDALAVLPDDVIVSSAHLAAVRTVGTQTFEALRRRKDGALVRVDVTMRWIEVPGRAPYVAVGKREVSWLRQHESLRETDSLFRNLLEVAPDAIAKLERYAWPGNIRELQSVMRQALLAATGTVLHARFLPDLTAAAPATTAAAAPAFDLHGFIRERLVPGATDVHAETHREVDRILMTLALQFTGGNHRDAAKTLGISRQTMRTRMRSLGLHVAHVVGSDDDDDGD